jgi:mannonate dehydratase
MDSVLHPVQRLQKYFYLNAGCVVDGIGSDLQYRERLYRLQNGLSVGARAMLLAFDYHYDPDGRRRSDHSPFYVSNSYARDIAGLHPDRFDWIASIHPYRSDAVAALERAVREGARAVKWLPPAMGMDPASAQCDPFYEALARLRVPLLTHGGSELAVHGGPWQELGNPLRLRRPLEHGVRVIVAHCASLGRSRDLDQGGDGPKRSNFDLFSRLMDEHRYEGLLWGEVSAITQINRAGAPLRELLRRKDWQDRLVNGSDYPLPGIFPLFSLRQLVRQQVLDPLAARDILPLRRSNPLLFDFVLKRSLSSGGRRFGHRVFESAALFARGGANSQATAYGID